MPKGKKYDRPLKEERREDARPSVGTVLHEMAVNMFAGTRSDDYKRMQRAMSERQAKRQRNKNKDEAKKRGRTLTGKKLQEKKDEKRKRPDWAY